MRVEHLSLANFRNYKSLELPLNAGRVLLYGRNGQGKTNAVEAIAYFNELMSHRVSADAALINAGNTTAINRMKVGIGSRIVQLELEITQGRTKRAQINSKPAKPRDLTDLFTSIVFAPEDLQIVRGEPAVRRAFIDSAIVTRQPMLAGIFRDYEKILKQRNTLLRQLREFGGSTANLDIWTNQLIAYGTRIIAERRKFVQDISPYLQNAYLRLVENDHCPKVLLEETISRTSEDVSRETLQNDFIAALAKEQHREIQRGLSLVGPHRDDLLFQLNNLPVKGYASHGETWSFVLALKLALAELVRAESTMGDPVLILDDVFAELDVKRRENLMAAVGDYEQVIVTAAVLEDVPDLDMWQKYRVQSGHIEVHND